MSLLLAENLRFTRAGRDVLAGIELDLEEGELLAVVGPSGSGKTTLLRVLAGLERLDAGEVYLAGRRITDLPPEARDIGLVFQDYALFPHLDVAGNVGFGLYGRADRDRVVKDLLDRFGLTAFARRPVHALSGGQQQRVALARALAPGPRLVLLDEPFSSLDAGLRERVREEVRSALKAAGTAALLVTHDQEEALSIADRLAVLHEGQIVQTGSPEEVYLRPKTPFVARFLGHTNLVPGKAEGETARTLLGPVTLAAPARGPVLLSIRPEHLALLPPDAPEGVPGRVVARRYKGHDLTFQVQVGEKTLRVQTDYRAPWRPGDAVRVVVREPAAVLSAKRYPVLNY